MAYIIDIILIAVFAFIVAFAVKKGFAKIALNLAATVLSYITAYIFGKPAAELLYDKAVRAIIEKALAERIEKSSAGDILTQTKGIIEALPEGLMKLAEKIGFNATAAVESISNTDVSAKGISAAVTESVLKPMIVVLLTVLCSIIIFILASIIFGFLAKLINKVFKMPLVKNVNRFLGGVVGIIQGVIILFVICSAFYFFGGLLGGKMAGYIDNSLIIKFINGINPIISRFKL